MPRPAFAAGIARLGERYRLVYDQGIYSTEGFLAGDDARRRNELGCALGDSSLRAIFCARGGYGAMRLLDGLDLTPLSADPRPLVGFSDITALHAAMACAGLVGIHGPTVTQLGDLPTDDFVALCALLEETAAPPPWRGLQPLVVPPTRCQISGPLIGGNLELLTRLLGTPYFPPIDGAVLLLEDVGERPYRIDRALTQIELSGVWQRVAAVVVGDFVQCTGRPGEPPVEAVLAERLGRLAVPVLLAAPVGHGQRNRAFAHGGLVDLDARSGTVYFRDSAVV